MTVDQLITNLKTYPGDLPVYVQDTRNGITDSLSIYPRPGNEFTVVNEQFNAGSVLEQMPGTVICLGYSD